MKISIPPEQLPDFRDIPGFAGYKINKEGTVITGWKRHRHTFIISDRWNVLRTCIHPITKRHAVYLIYKNGVRPKIRYISRLVLEAFVGLCPPGMECCHNDGDISNNTLSNLRWDTHKGNDTDKDRHNTRPKGNTHWNVFLSEDEVRDIRLACKMGVSQKVLARIYRVSQMTISDINVRKTWRHLA